MPRMCRQQRARAWSEGKAARRWQAMPQRIAGGAAQAGGSPAGHAAPRPQAAVVNCQHWEQGLVPAMRGDAQPRFLAHQAVCARADLRALHVCARLPADHGDCVL